MCVTSNAVLASGKTIPKTVHLDDLAVAVFERAAIEPVRAFSFVDGIALVANRFEACEECVSVLSQCVVGTSSDARDSDARCAGAFHLACVVAIFPEFLELCLALSTTHIVLCRFPVHAERIAALNGRHLTIVTSVAYC
jgi:hypothetical protein